MSDDISEFIKAVQEAEDQIAKSPNLAGLQLTSKPEAIEEKESPKGRPVQYAYYSSGFMPATGTIKSLPAGVYDIVPTNQGVYADPIPNPTGLLLDLPEMKSDYVVKLVEQFWASEKDYKEGNEFVIGGATFKAGLMIYGPPGCHAAGTEILMFDGTIKNVEDVEVGDLLMGPDSKPRTVLELKRGREEMVKIKPVKGKEFIINKSHILHLTPSGKDVLTQTPINMKFGDWLLQKQNFQIRYKLTRTGVNFEQKDLPIDPYFLGLWLGDGTSRTIDITTMDSEIKEYLINFATKNNLECKVRPSTSRGQATTYAITAGNCIKGEHAKNRNKILTSFQEMELIENKHIPYIYKTSSREQRLELLAGIIDTDGHLHKKTIDFISRSEVFANDVVFLTQSLGFASYLTKTEKQCVNNGVWGTYFRVSISGDISQIPCKLPRKKSTKREQIKSVLRTGFSYEMLPVDNFYGFTLNEDHLYLTSDFTIHHNSGKSCTLKIVANKLIEKGGTVFYSSCHPYTTNKFLTDFSKIEKDRKCIVILEDIDSLIYSFGESGYLEMLDSAKTIDNVLFIATTNYPDKLDPRIYNRPGRFSHVVKIGLPTKAAREAYLKAILKNHRDVETIVDKTHNFTIDHLTALINAVYREKKDLHEEIERLKSLFQIPKIKDDEVGIALGRKD